MARNAIESEFRTSKMADGCHFVKKFKQKVTYMLGCEGGGGHMGYEGGG